VDDLARFGCKVGPALACRKWKARRSPLRADGHDLSFVTVEGVDVNGELHPNAEHPVTFSLKGPGSIAAEETYRGNQRKLFRGKALVIVRTLRTAGALTLTATAPGLRAANLNVKIVLAKE
jgi:beta-galactosidase